MPPDLYNNRRNPYLIKNEGRTAVFRVPFWKPLLLRFFGTILCVVGGTIFVGLVKLGGFDFVQDRMILGMLGVSGFCVLGCGICLMLSTGVSKVSFDLQRRTYSRGLAAPVPLFGSRYLDAVGMGSPFARKIIAGSMNEIAGVQVVERGSGNAKTYSVYVVFVDQNVSPCVVYYSTSLLDAQAQLQQVASLLSLPRLKTLLTRDTEPLPVPYHRSPVRNSYLAYSDQKTVVFRTPRWRTILSICLAGFLCGLPLYGMIVTMQRWEEPNVFLLIEGLPLIVFGIFIALCSGANEMSINLEDRSYRRILLPLPAITGAKSRNLTGTGNPFGGRIMEGRMNEIEGVRLVEGRGKNGRLYAIKLIWFENAYPPFVVYFSDGNMEDAKVQQVEIAKQLELLILAPDLLDRSTHL